MKKRFRNRDMLWHSDIFAQYLRAVWEMIERSTKAFRLWILREFRVKRESERPRATIINTSIDCEQSVREGNTASPLAAGR